MNELIPATDEIIIIEQLPIIKEQLEAVRENIRNRVKTALALACSEDSTKAKRTVRAALNKEKDAFEERRKQVKAAIMRPYEDFYEVYKACVLDEYENAVAELTKGINADEAQIKQSKTQEIKDYFNEYAAASGIDFVPFERSGINVTLSVSVKSLKDAVKKFVTDICADLTLIETQEFKTEILVEYKRSLDVSQAVTAVKKRHEELAAEKNRQHEQEALKAAQAEAAKKVEAALPPPVPAPLAPPTQAKPEKDPNELLTPSFRLEPTKRADVRRLGAWLEDNGIKYTLI